jgi:uncharacterized protein (TIGR02246 family)
VGISRQYVQGIIDVYINAWEAQDPDLIVTIFTPDATYHERVMGDPIPGRDAIRRYWETKVAGSQANITCRLLSLYVDGSTAIAEWAAEFDDLAQGVRKRMKEIAVLEFEWTMERGYLISSLREYWASETTAVLAAVTGDTPGSGKDAQRTVSRP